MATVTTKERDVTAAEAVKQFGQLGNLLGQGYSKGPAGRGCWHCGALGVVYSKPVPRRRVENEFCGTCGSHRVVGV